MSIQKHIILLMLLFSGFFAVAQHLENFSVRTLTPENGLSQGSNYFSYEDALGFLWIAANDAVNRFDGKQVKVYNLNRYFENCPNLSQAYGIAEDAVSNMYFGSINGLYCYSRKKGTFSIIPIYKNIDQQLTMPFGFRDGKVWCFNNRYEISSYDVATKEVRFFTKLNLPEMLSVHIYNQNFSKSFYQNFPLITGGHAWFTSKNEVMVLDLENKSIENPLKSLAKNHPFVFNATSHSKTKNQVLFSTDQGLIIYDLKNKEAEMITVLDGVPLKNMLAAVSNEKMLVTYQQNKLTIFNQARKVIYENRNEGTCYNFKFDKNNRLWFCDDGKGVIIYDFAPPLIQKFPDGQFAGKIKAIGVSTIHAINSDEILINSSAIWNKKKKQIEYPSILEKFKFNYRTAADKLNDGIWIFKSTPQGSTDALYFLNGEKRITFFAKQHLAPLGTIQHMRPLSQNIILLACEKGLFTLNKRDNKIEAVSNQLQLNAFYISSLSNRRIAVSYIDQDMLLGRIDDGGNFTLEKRLLPGKQCFYLQEDFKKKQYWVATNNGLFLLDRNFNLIQSFTADSGMAGTYIYGLLQDDSGNIWVSHQRGLSSISTTTHQIINYDLHDGVQDWDFNNRAFCSTSDGTLFFGGARGFNYMKPPLRHRYQYAPKVYVDEIKVNTAIYRPGENPDFMTDLNLTHLQNNISVKAGIRDLQNAESYKIAYRLNCKKWFYLAAGSPINYNSLWPEDYQLELGIYDKFSNRITVQKVVHFSIEFPVYQQIWFWAIISIVMTALLFYFISQRRMGVQKSKFLHKLEIERERNKITTDLHDDVGASLSSLQINSAVAQKLLDKNPHEARKILKKIEAQAKSISEHIGDIIWSLKSNKDEFMSLSTRIKKITSEILGSIDIHYKIEIDPYIDTEICDFPTRKNIILICKEALNNILKHSKATKVNLRIKRQPGWYLLEISDNGIGCCEGKTEGNGLLNMRKRTQELGGNFELFAESGTVINIKIPRIRET